MPSLFYSVPLTAVISLVYCTTRYEMPARIFQSATMMFVKTITGLAILYAILWYLSS
ncbi:hypothetical protein [Fuerstiella marisgermanici]|uniref:Uncharacterized protein n=1 Tax=Fuerstiella marisgermanici TaxID=1891926 RepID=A0A1P8WJX5_9PLAN|nr:hypothetical protein [Fuerstiella marisgermanici]APZ94351.1 hypothetical protein Fuma_03979 [Fuerstiella marisgermanici]